LVNYLRLWGGVGCCTTGLLVLQLLGTVWWLLGGPVLGLLQMVVFPFGWVHVLFEFGTGGIVAWWCWYGAYVGVVFCVIISTGLGVIVGWSLFVCVFCSYLVFVCISVLGVGVLLFCCLWCCGLCVTIVIA